jgi:putative phosphoesterase
MGMTLAVLADIHGNTPALEAVLADLQPIHIDGMIVAGDMVVGPNSTGVIRRLRDLGAWMIRGNNEGYMIQLEAGVGPASWQSARQWAPMRWAYQHLDPESLEFIRSLPMQQVITRPGKDAIRVVHGSPGNPSEHLYPGYGREALQRAVEAINEPVLVCGHSHIPWQEFRDGCLTFNPGAVSAPLNGVTGAQYALLEWKGDGWELDLRHVPYDLDLARQEFVRSGFLEAGGAFAQALLMEIEQGRHVAQAFLNHARQVAVQAGCPELEVIPDEIWAQAEATFDWESSTDVITDPDKELGTRKRTKTD